jgi:hypothetical protein
LLSANPEPTAQAGLARAQAANDQVLIDLKLQIEKLKA